MKIRIKGPSVRFRLSRSEVTMLVHQGYFTETTPFGGASFCYALQRIETGDALSAQFEQGCITLFVPEILIADWDTNNLISIESHMPLTDNQTLYLLLEKDFQCLDAVTEDQRDNYTNPNKNC